MLNNKYSTKITEFLYFTNYRDNQKDICDLELKSMFGFIPKSKIFYSSNYIEPSRSVFIRGCIGVINKDDSIEQLEKSVLAENLDLEKYKIHYVEVDQDVRYEERLSALRTIGYAIEGTFDLQNPLTNLGLVKINGQWIFGYYSKNDGGWLKRREKPNNFCYALDVWLARSIVNIAIKNDYSLKLVDPCCGVGTVIIESRNLGINIDGYELNPIVAEYCNENLRHLGFDDNIKNQDLHDIDSHYDVAIVDLPYGKHSTTTLSEQAAIIWKTREIASKAIIVTMEDMSGLLMENGFDIEDMCVLTKDNGFSRYIMVCQ